MLKPGNSEERNKEIKEPITMMQLCGAHHQEGVVFSKMHEKRVKEPPPFYSMMYCQ